MVRPRVLVFRENETWLAQCLEYDVCCQGSDVRTLLGSMEIALALEKEKERETGERPRPAPYKFFEMWRDKEGYFVPEGGPSEDFEVGIALS